MLQYISVLYSYFLIGLKTSLCYPLQIVFSIFSGFVIFFVQCILWLYISHKGDISYSASNVVTYFFVGFVLNALFSLGVDNVLGSRISRGFIIQDLLKPVSVGLACVSERFGNIGIKVILILISLLPFIVYLSYLSLSGKGVVLAMLLLPVSFLFLASFEFLLACIAFRTQSYWGIVTIKSSIVLLLSGRFFPFDVLHHKIATIVSWNPFAIAYYQTAQFALGLHKSSFFILFLVQLLWALLAIMFSLLAWRMGLKKLAIQGG